MLIKAIGKKIGISSRKARLVADTVKGMNALLAVNTLKYINKGSATHISKVIESAIANAKHNLGVAESSLYVKDIRLDRGMYQRRIYYTGKGGARFLLKPSTHITVILEDGDAVTKSTKNKADKTKTVLKKGDVKSVENVKVAKKATANKSAKKKKAVDSEKWYNHEVFLNIL